MTLSLKVLSAPKALKAAAAAGAAPGAAPAPAAPPVKRVIHVAYPTGLPAGYLDAQVGHLIIWPPVCLNLYPYRSLILGNLKFLFSLFIRTD